MTEARNAADLTQWVEDLVCPVCFASLHFSVADVVCTGCSRAYPIVDRIPVLIESRATVKAP